MMITAAMNLLVGPLNEEGKGMALGGVVILGGNCGAGLLVWTNS